MRDAGEETDMKKNLKTNTIADRISGIRYDASFAMLPGDERHIWIRLIVLRMVNSVLGRVAKGANLENAIRLMEIGFDSDALKLQYFVAADDGAGWCAPDLTNPLSHGTYVDLDQAGDEQITVWPLRKNGGDMIYGFAVTFNLNYNGRAYYGYCNVEDPRFRKISRREIREKRKEMLTHRKAICRKA